MLKNKPSTGSFLESESWMCVYLICLILVWSSILHADMFCITVLIGPTCSFLPTEKPLHPSVAPLRTSHEHLQKPPWSFQLIKKAIQIIGVSQKWKATGKTPFGYSLVKKWIGHSPIPSPLSQWYIPSGPRHQRVWKITSYALAIGHSMGWDLDFPNSNDELKPKPWDVDVHKKGTKSFWKSSFLPRMHQKHLQWRAV